MKGVIIPFGAAGTMAAPDRYNVQYAAESSGLAAHGIKRHYNPDLVRWFYVADSDVPGGEALARLAPGDGIFFATSLAPSSADAPTPPGAPWYLVAFMALARVESLGNLLAREPETTLDNKPPYSFHPHVQRHFHAPKDSEPGATVFHGDLGASRVLREPVPWARVVELRGQEPATGLEPGPASEQPVVPLSAQDAGILKAEVDARAILPKEEYGQYGIEHGPRLVAGEVVWETGEKLPEKKRE